MVRMIDAEEVRRTQELGEGAVILDVLSAESYANRHVPGAVNADVHAPDFDAVAQRAAPDKDAPVVVYCASMDCSASTRAAERLEALGYGDVREFKAGLQGWREAGHAFERIRTETRPPERDSAAAAAST